MIYVYFRELLIKQIDFHTLEQKIGLSTEVQMIYIYIYMCVCVCVCACVCVYIYIYIYIYIYFKMYLFSKRFVFLRIINFILTFVHVSSLLLSSENIS